MSSTCGIGSTGSSLASMLQDMQKKMQTAFTQSDTNGDGKLSKTEFAGFDALMKADAPQGAQAAGGAGGAKGPSVDDMFSAMDTDGDGSVSLAEMQAFKPPVDTNGMATLLQTQEADSGTTSTGTSTDTSLTDIIGSLLQQMLSQYSQQASGSAASSLLGSATASVTA